jgi:hypothetical protein
MNPVFIAFIILMCSAIGLVVATQRSFGVYL